MFYQAKLEENLPPSLLGHLLIESYNISIFDEEEYLK